MDNSRLAAIVRNDWFMRAAIYLRMSMDRSAREQGVRRQEEDCRALAREFGWTVLDVFCDNAVSAVAARRPEYERLMESVRTGSVDVIIAWHIDRLHRSPQEFETYVQVCSARHVSTHTVRSGRFDLSASSDRLVARVLVAAAAQEVEHRAERTRRAQQQSAENGRWLGGSRPFGWRMDPISLEPVESALIVDACTRVLSGSSLHALVADWNSRGVQTAYGNAWSVTPMRQMLLRARNAGLSTWEGRVVGESRFPAIVDEATWRAVTQLLKDPARRKSSSNQVRWLLAGIARCACGETVRSAKATARDGSSRTIYRCSVRSAGLKHVSKNAQPSDAVVASRVRAQLMHMDISRALNVGAQNSTQEAARLRRVLSDAADAFCAGKIDQPQLHRISQKARRALAEISEQQVRSVGIVAPRLAPVDKLMFQVWDEADLQGRREIVRNGFLVRLLPSPVSGARVFDASLVEVSVTREPR